ncbi:hypothetical protein A4A49_09415 [Nicotiana attenuata]|uniref:NTP pyrophosphohydrolase MazG putative catalytic core domain-containing protein n=1 Tax=Nicotiana attenuata TaxID=49451 RepID=A0A1J6JCP9_NICAT|nr:hypothetical protein A4A49_09415 [Nicotiana attenuata]
MQHFRDKLVDEAAKKKILVEQQVLQQQVLNVQGEIEAETTDGSKAMLTDANFNAGAQIFNNSVISKNVAIVPMDRALARMSQAMAIEAGNRVLNERGNGSDIVTVTGGNRTGIATNKKPDNAVGYEVATVNGEGHEHVSVADLEKQNDTTPRFEKLEKSAGDLQASTVALTHTADRADSDHMVIVAGGCRPINATTEQFCKVAGDKAATLNGDGYEHVSVEALEWTNATTSQLEFMAKSAGVLQYTVDQRADDPKAKTSGQLKANAVQKYAFQVMQHFKNAEDNVQPFFHDKEKISVAQEIRPTVAAGVLCENSLSLKKAVMHVDEKVLNTKRQVATTPHKADTKSSNWTVVGEVGELSEIFQWKGEVPKGLPNWEEKEKQHLGEELSDLLLYLVRLSDMCGIDLAKAALRKVELNAIKYPVSLYKGSSKKLTLSTNININNGSENGSEIRYFFSVSEIVLCYNYKSFVQVIENQEDTESIFRYFSITLSMHVNSISQVYKHKQIYKQYMDKESKFPCELP